MKSPSSFALGIVGMALSLFAQGLNAEQPAGKAPFLIGGFADGIYLSLLDLEDGSMEPPRRLIEVPKPAFFCFHPTLNRVYSVTESSRKDAQSPSAVTSMIWDGKSQSLIKLNAQPVDGDGPCHISTDQLGQVALVANYSSGSLVIFPLDQQGALEPSSQTILHRGELGTNRARQDRPHAHSIFVDPTGQWVLACDLGLDQVMVYRLDRANRSLDVEPSFRWKLPPGSGPRHLAFDPEGTFVFVINELTSTMTSGRWNSIEGRVDTVETVSTLPNGERVDNTTAEILVHPNGKFVFGSNRGHDSIVSFQIDRDSGRLQLVGHCSSGGKTPRNFRIDPSGRFLLVQNQQSNSIYSLTVDPTSGELKQTGHFVSQPSPACIKFVPPNLRESE